MLTRERRFVRGFTLIELLITVAIASIVLALGVPAMSQWVRRASVTNMAESIQNGLRLTFGEAIRRNAPVQFLLTDSSVASADVTAAVAKANGAKWLSRVLDASSFPTSATAVSGGFVAAGSASELSGSSKLTVEGPASVIFNGAGRVIATDGTLLSEYQIYRVSMSDADRALCVFVTPGGGTKSCDPSYASGDARACQPILTVDQCKKAGT